MLYPRNLPALIVITLSCALAAQAEDWPKYRRDYANTGHSAETGTLANGVTTVTSSNIHSLSLKWSKTVNGMVSGTPVVVAGVVYFGTWNGVFYALDAVTGATKWSKTLCSCRIAGTAMVSGGVVYIGTSTAKLFALSAATGSTVWSKTLSTQTGADIWGSPVVFNGQVYIGVASHFDDPCVKGVITAVNASTGAITWFFNTINQATCPTGAGTCVGAGVWSSAAVDAATGVVYFGTGNPGSTCVPSTANATQWPDSILALKASTGGLLSAFKAIPNDTADRDFGSSPVLVTTGSASPCVGTTATQNWVGEASKNGVMYFLTRGSNGAGSSPHQISVGSGAVTSPGVLSSCSSSGVSNNFFITVPSGNFVGVNQSTSGSLTKKFITFVSSAAMFSAPAIVNDVVFFGSKDFKLHAATRSGTLIWSFPTGKSVNSGPAVSNGRIYFGSNDGHVFCLSINAK